MSNPQPATDGHPQYDPHITELIEFAEEEGLELPYPAHVIAQLERIGGVVDLVTSEIYPRQEHRRMHAPTAEARALVEAGECGPC